MVLPAPIDRRNRCLSFRHERQRRKGLISYSDLGRDNSYSARFSVGAWATEQSPVTVCLVGVEQWKRAQFYSAT